MESNTPQFPEAKGEGASSKTAIIAVLVLVVLGGVVWYALQMNKPAPIKEGIPSEQTAPTETTPTQGASVETGATDTASAALSAQGSSDEISDIDKDLNNTDLTILGDVSKI